MSSCSWVAALLPIRTGAEPRYPSRCSSTLLGDLAPAVDAVHDLERARSPRCAFRSNRSVSQSMNAARLLGEAEPQQRVERKRRVADPGVAVVPVALAAEHLGQARGRRRDDRARWAVGEELQRQRGAVHGLAPAAPVARLRQPPAPVLTRCARTAPRLLRAVAVHLVLARHALEDERRALAVPRARNDACTSPSRTSTGVSVSSASRAARRSRTARRPAWRSARCRSRP